MYLRLRRLLGKQGVGSCCSARQTRQHNHGAHGGAELRRVTQVIRSRTVGRRKQGRTERTRASNGVRTAPRVRFWGGGVKVRCGAVHRCLGKSFFRVSAPWQKVILRCGLAYPVEPTAQNRGRLHSAPYRKTAMVERFTAESNAFPRLPMRFDAPAAISTLGGSGREHREVTRSSDIGRRAKDV